MTEEEMKDLIRMNRSAVTLKTAEDVFRPALEGYIKAITPLFSSDSPDSVKVLKVVRHLNELIFSAIRENHYPTEPTCEQVSVRMVFDMIDDVLLGNIRRYNEEYEQKAKADK